MRAAAAVLTRSARRERLSACAGRNTCLRESGWCGCGRIGMVGNLLLKANDHMQKIIFLLPRPLLLLLDGLGHSLLDADVVTVTAAVAIVA